MPCGFDEDRPPKKYYLERFLFLIASEHEFFHDPFS